MPTKYDNKTLITSISDDEGELWNEGDIPPLFFKVDVSACLLPPFFTGAETPEHGDNNICFIEFIIDGLRAGALFAFIFIIAL